MLEMSFGNDVDINPLGIEEMEGDESMLHYST